MHTVDSSNKDSSSLRFVVGDVQNPWQPAQKAMPSCPPSRRPPRMKGTKPPPRPFTRPPYLDPIINPDHIAILRKPQLIFSGVSKDYVEHWTPEMAVDEHVQNWRDQMEIAGKGRDVTLQKSPSDHGVTFFTTCNELLAVLVVRKSDESGRTVVTLRNYSARLFPSYFQFGASGKRDLRNCRGKFGDGLPSSTLVLTRYSTGGPDGQKRKVVVASCGREYTFGFERGEISHESSCFTIYNHPFESSLHPRAINGALPFDSSQDTEITLHLQYNDFDPSRYLFLHEIPKERMLASSDGQVILDPKYQGNIYLRGMRAQRTGHFGYNFESVSSRSRDRQNTIPLEELQEHVVDLWLTLVHNPKAARALYDSLLTDSDSLESRAFQDTNKNTSVASNKLATVFRERNDTGFPLMQGNNHGKSIVEKHLKKKPVFVTRTLFQLLSGAEKLEVSVLAAWRTLIKEFIAKVTVIRKDPLSQRLCDDVTSVIEPLVKNPVTIQMVSDEIPGGNICAIDGPRINSFNLSGFHSTRLNGKYKEMSGKNIHGREAFRGGRDDDYCLVWNSSLSRWSLVSYMDLPTWSRQSTSGAYAICNLDNFWNNQRDSEWCQWAEAVDGKLISAKGVIVAPHEQTAKAGLSGYRVFVSREAVTNHCHDLTLRANRDDCESHEMYENTCFCAHDLLVDMITEALRQQCRVYISKKALKKQLSALYKIFFNTHKEWKQLCGGAAAVYNPPVPAQNNAILAKWLSGLRDGSTSLADDATDPAMKQIKDLCISGLLRAGRPLQADAYLGDAFLDLYVAWEGIMKRLSANDMDQLRRAILSNANMGGKQRATLFEAEVGKEVQKWPKETWLNLAGPISDLAMPKSRETLCIKVARCIKETMPISSDAQQNGHRYRGS
eukprot:GEMP01000953.1.p1 GENE.GEMP01000953.1~~GEMP01000953.1.p1  ORF type:complete len:894 (+),score=156.15 GEMP01000953.1:264-2945(+)